MEGSQGHYAKAESRGESFILYDVFHLHKILQKMKSISLLTRCQAWWEGLDCKGAWGNFLVIEECFILIELVVRAVSFCQISSLKLMYFILAVFVFCCSVTNYCTLRGFKITKIYYVKFWRSEVQMDLIALKVQMDLTALKARCQQGCIPYGDSRGKYISLPFPPLEAAYIPWLRVPFLYP